MLIIDLLLILLLSSLHGRLAFIFRGNEPYLLRNRDDLVFALIMIWWNSIDLEFFTLKGFDINYILLFWGLLLLLILIIPSLRLWGFNSTFNHLIHNVLSVFFLQFTEVNAFFVSHHLLMLMIFLSISRRLKNLISYSFLHEVYLALSNKFH